MVDWSVFGRHEAYGNGLKRAKLRGWIYGVVAVAGALALARRDLGPSRQPMACATLVVYWWGAVLHLVPFTSGEGYCAALAVDFCVITSVYTAHVAVYCGPSPTTALSLSMSAVLVASMASAVFATPRLSERAGVSRTPVTSEGRRICAPRSSARGCRRRSTKKITVFTCFH